MESIFTAMRRCQLFDGIPEDKYQNVLNCLHGEVRTIPRNTVLLRIGERQRRPGVVMSGTLRISLYSEDGNLPFQEYAERWLARQVRYAPGTLESYRRMLERVYPFIGNI